VEARKYGEIISRPGTCKPWVDPEGGRAMWMCAKGNGDMNCAVEVDDKVIVGVEMLREDADKDVTEIAQEGGM
jgi:hypothetical protein